jgi:hypothetical protein
MVSAPKAAVFSIFDRKRNATQSSPVVVFALHIASQRRYQNMCGVRLVLSKSVGEIATTSSCRLRAAGQPSSVASCAFSFAGSFRSFEKHTTASMFSLTRVVPS